MVSSSFFGTYRNLFDFIDKQSQENHSIIENKQ